MTPPQPARFAAGVLSMLSIAMLCATPVSAQTLTGSIEGRVQSSASGNYLNNVRLTVAGTQLTTLTNELGEYRIDDVPAGEARVTVFYSSLPPQTVTVHVTAGQRAVRDIEMKMAPQAGDTVKLDAFTVSASRQMSEIALATNEQRFAPNMKTVLAAESFGDQSEGNVGEFLKFMPGMFINYVDQDARSASVRGMPAYTTIVTSNGNAVASAAAGADRTFEFEKLAINDAAQIEFNKTLLPDMPAEGIGGTINIVTKSAFQRSRPQFNYRTYLNVNSTRPELRKTYGVDRNPTFKIKPGFDFTYIKPVNKSFGFTVGGAISSKFNPHNLSTNTWVLNPAAGTGIENPFLQGFTMQDTPKFTDRYSGRVGIDWRFAPNDVLTLGYSQQYYDAVWIGRRWQADTAANPTAFSSEFTQSRPNVGVVQFTGNAGHKSGTTWTPEFKYTHHGPEWKSEVRGAYSHASYHYRCLERGHFQNIVMTLGSFNAAGNVIAPTVRLSQTHDLVPGLTAVLADGSTPDPRDVNNFVIGRGTEFFREGFDVKKSLFAHTRRVIKIGVPVAVKVGGDIRQAIRDVRGSDPVYTFVGADGRANTRDDAVSAVGMDLEDGYSVVAPPFSQPKFKWPSQYKLHDLYLAHPNWWTRDLAGEHSMTVANSKFLVETITSGFVRLDASFFRNRVSVVGGGRFQNYRSRADAGEVDTLGLYVRDEEGNLITNPATGQPIRATGSALAITQTTNIERAVTTKGVVNGFYPSFNSVWRVTENIQLRAGYASSISYPNLNQLAAVTTVSDLTASPRRLTANSPLQPWLGKNYDVDLEYYTASGGSFTLAFFRKDISNFVNSVRLLAGTPAARAALDKYGYGELAPLNYEVVEQYNGGEATTQGWEFGLHQDLNPYLPAWARGLTVFANTSYTAAPKGISRGNIAAASQRLMNWGVTVRRGPLGASLRWNHKPEQKEVVPINTHRISYTYLDVDLSYRFSPAMTIFANAANITEAPAGSYIYTANTPDYARRRQYNLYGVQCTFGLKGQF